MYSWGGVGQKFPNDEKYFRILKLSYELGEFAFRKIKTQFTNKNTHILRTDISHAATSYPGSFHYAPRWRKDPPGWSRVSQILGDNKIFT